MKRTSSSKLGIAMFFHLLAACLLLKRSMANPRIRTVKIICKNQVHHHSPSYITNFATAMGNLSNQVRSSRFGESVAGSDPYTIYGLAQCYGDLSSFDCVLCYAQAWTVLPQCFPSIGGRIYLDGCFTRYENYSFHEEYFGPNDTAICGNKTQKESAFQNAVKKAVLQAVANGPTNKGYAREKVLVTRVKDERVYVLANCWETLNSSSCQACLKNASLRVLACLPSSEGRAMNTGCFIRYSDFDFLNKQLKSGMLKGATTIIVVSVVSSLILLVVGIAAGMYFRKLRMIKKKRRASDDAEKLVLILHDSSLNFKYSTLEKATESFAEANKLGQGGFGTVYKGVLHDGREIAVKRLFFNNKHRAADFYNEVNIISSVRHRNLVRLLGCSCSGPESLLVYEYLPNKSLDRYIFGQQPSRTLNWVKRYNIMIGTAAGLVYLHENSNARIIHRDIKASNILLDSRFHAKIADFGLARTFQEDESHISTAIAGTLGYMAPEYLAHGRLTEKADVYSFGVLLLEMVTGMQNNQTITEAYSENLVTTVWKHFQLRMVDKLLDPKLQLHDHNHSNIKEEVLRVVHIGLLCTQEVPSLRPSMSRALQMLKKKEEHLPTPTSPPFIDEKTMEFNEITEDPSYPLKEDYSIATLTCSSFYGR